MEPKNSSQQQPEEGFPKQLIVLVIVIALGVVVLVLKSMGLF